jgi:hypothetical protein
MSEIEEIAKAGQKAAELGTQSLKTAERVGGFMARVFKEPIEECAGLLTDKLKLIRLRNWDKTADEVEAILAKRHVIETRAVPPKLAFTILDESSLEDDPILSRLWSELLANAMDPGFAAEIRSAYPDIIKHLAPLDAKTLAVMYSELAGSHRIELSNAGWHGFPKSGMCRRLGLDNEEEYLVAVNNLIRLGCVASAVQQATVGDRFGVPSSQHLTIDRGTDVIVLTPLGIRFVEACIGDGAIEVAGESIYTHILSLPVEIPLRLRAANL